MENKLSQKEFGYRTVISSSLQLMRENYIQLIGITIITLLLGAVSTILNYLVPLLFSGVSSSIITILVVFPIGLVSMYFSIRVIIVLYFSIYDQIYYQERGFGQKYKDAGAVVWKYIGTSLLIGLIIGGIYIASIIIGLIGGLAISVFDKLGILSIVVAIAFGLAVVTLILFAIVKLYLSLPIRIFNPEVENYFNHSRSLVKGQFFKVLSLYLTPALIQLPIFGVAIYFMIIGAINNWVYMGIIYISSLFITPLFACGFVVMYVLLREKYTYDTSDDQEQMVEQEVMI